MEHSKTVIILLSILMFFTYGVQSTSRKLTEPIVESSRGDVYDCIDFYKQPAFNNPLLANHTFHPEMRPSSMPTIRRSANLLLDVDDGVKVVRQMRKSCPIGTVPIRRITEEDRIRERLLVESNSDDTHYAIGRTRTNDPARKYNGGAADITTWNPSVQDSQYSSGQMVIRNGQDSIQIGWTVNPSLYRDHAPHAFIYTSVGSTRCYNLFCSAFVIVDKNFAVDQLLPESRVGGPSNGIRVMIVKDKNDGNWWLAGGSNFTHVGFWPKEVFNADMATSIEWGGQAYSPPNLPSPPMGAGTFLTQNLADNAFCQRVQIINDQNQVVDAEEDSIEEYATSGYQAIKSKLSGKEFGTVFIWGGPGSGSG